MLIEVIAFPEQIVCDVGTTTGALGEGNKKEEECFEVERVL